MVKLYTDVGLNSELWPRWNRITLIVCTDFNAFIYIICWCSVINQMFSANCNIDGVRRSMVGVVLLVWWREGVRDTHTHTDYAENHFQRMCALTLTMFLWRPLC